MPTNPDYDAGPCMTCRRFAGMDPYSREVLCSICDAQGADEGATSGKASFELSWYDRWWITQAVAQSADV